MANFGCFVGYPGKRRDIEEHNMLVDAGITVYLCSCTIICILVWILPSVVTMVRMSMILCNS